MESSLNLNISKNDTRSPPPGDGALHVFSIYETVFWFVLYGIIALLAIFGNFLVIYVVVTREKMQNVTGFFIVNLAVGDCLTGMLAIPFKFQAALLQRWLLPQFMCNLIPFAETVSLSVSVFTLTGTAVDRFRAVVFPTHSRMTKNGARFIIFLIWAVSIGCSVPYGLFHAVIMTEDEETGELTVPQCFPSYHETAWWKAYNIYLTIVQYFVPLLLINGAYCVIGYNVWLTKPVIDSARAAAFEQSKRKVIKMLVIVVMVFTFCWLPYEAYLILAEVTNINQYRYVNILFFCSHWMAMSNSCLNPIIYGVYNEKFQKEYKAVLTSCCRAGRAFRATSRDDVHMDSYVDSNQPNDGAISLQKNRILTLEDEDAAPTNSCHYYIASELGRDDD